MQSGAFFKTIPSKNLRNSLKFDIALISHQFFVEIIHFHQLLYN